MNRKLSSALITPVLAGLLFAAGCATLGKGEKAVVVQPIDWKKPIVIGHRGASGYRPEHTLEAYRTAIEMGADFIEPDLVMTKDGVLIARHENEISGTTDVAEKFPAFKKTKVIDGETVEGWFTEDFTLAEIKTLRAKERLPFRDQSHNGKYPIPTFQEIIDLAKEETQRRGRQIGLYPETKHPSYFRSLGLPLEPALIQILVKNDLNRPDSPVIIQSFEVSNLRELRTLTPLRLVQLIGDPKAQPFDVKASGKRTNYLAMLMPDGLKAIAGYANGIGPAKDYILPVLKDGHLSKPSPVTKWAKQAGLFVHPYTFRNESQFLNADYKGDAEAEYAKFYEIGVDGVFSDFPDVAVRARAK